MTDHRIWWIDDRPEREEKAKGIQQNSESITIEFSIPDKATSQIKDDSIPDVDLVLIDWVLSEDNDVISRGVSMEGILREHLPDTPIYGFSGEKTGELEEALNERHFEAVFQLRDIISTDGIRGLESDIRDYNQLDSVRGEGFEDLRDVMNPPAEAEEQLNSIIPRKFSEGLKKDSKTAGGSKIEFSHWIRERFLRTPGPLWDNQWLATNLGVTTDALEHLITRLQESDRDIKYDGIFAQRVDDRWWSSEIIGAVVAVADGSVSNIQQAAPQLVPEEHREIATCRYCEEEYPDTVAAIKEGENAEHPVHFRCSNVHHSREGPFEEYRVANKVTDTNGD
jgi:hypothetical protein